MHQAPADVTARLRDDLFTDSCLSLNYLVLAVCACAIATFGLLTNSAAVIIGAMIVAPLMMPLRGMAFGAIQGDFLLFRHSIAAVVVGAGLSVVLAALTQAIVNLPESGFAAEILNRTQPNLADLAIAIIAGIVSGFAKVRPRISDALAGTAISVALMPPLCVTGIFLTVGNFDASRGAFLLYATNLLGITLACTLVFAINGFHVSFHRTSRALAVGSVLTLLVAVPLFRSFTGLLSQARLRDNLRHVLERETVTVGQQVNLRTMRVDWNAKPHRVVLEVDARELVTPEQVSAVEAFLQRRLGLAAKKFELEFQVNQYLQVTAAPKPWMGEVLDRVAKTLQLRQIVSGPFVLDGRPTIDTLRLNQTLVDWQADPPIATLYVTANGKLTPAAVKSLIEGLRRQIFREMGENIRLRLVPTLGPQTTPGTPPVQTPRP